MSSIPPHLKDLLKNLEFLAMIEKGKKPCLSDMSFVSSKSWIGAFKRFQNSESKKQLVLFVDSVTEQTFTSIEDPRNKEHATMIIETLARAKIGISNALITYQNHPAFVSSIRVCLGNIDHQLKRFGEEYDVKIDELDKKNK